MDVANEVLKKVSKLPGWAKVALAIGGAAALRSAIASLTRRSRLDGDTVLITGAASGIGALMARKFAKLGASLVLWDLPRSGEALGKLKAEIEVGFSEDDGPDAPKQSVRTALVDVTNREVVEATAKEAGDIDILINNAGVVQGKELLEADPRAIVRTFQVNVISHFWTVRSFLPSMLAKNHGQIITIASAAGTTGVAKQCDYSASKWAAVGFDESLRMELQRKGASGVSTTCICPFFIDTGMFEGASTRFPLLLPILQADWAAERIVKAVLGRESVVYMPHAVALSPMLRGLVPTGVFDFCINLFGTNSTMDDFVGRPQEVASLASHGESGAAAGGGGGGGAAAASQEQG